MLQCPPSADIWIFTIHLMSIPPISFSDLSLSFIILEPGCPPAHWVCMFSFAVVESIWMTSQGQSDSGFGMSNIGNRNDSVLERRFAEAKRILTKYPDRIPVIVEKSARSTLPEIDKKKFLVPGSMLCGEFKYIIHKHLQSQLANSAESLSAEQTLYLFVKNTPPRTGMWMNSQSCLIYVGALMSELYEAFKDPDGFLYMMYSAENTLGVCQW